MKEKQSKLEGIEYLCATIQGVGNEWIISCMEVIFRIIIH
jgi:hypothetical protein